MPTYEYHCSRCKSTYELRQGFDAANTHTCEECHKGKAKRVLHAPRVVFKGGGFYATDSKKSTTSGTESKADSTGESKTESKSESKPAAEPAATTSSSSSESASSD